MGGFKHFKIRRGIVLFFLILLVVVSFSSADVQDDLKETIHSFLEAHPHTVLVSVSYDSGELACVRDESWNSVSC